MMKNIKAFILLVLAVSVTAGCYKDGTDYISGGLRISLSPSVTDFAADGSTVDGSENYSAAVIVNYGASYGGDGWTAEILEAPQWVRLSTVMITTTYPDTWGTGMFESQERGMEITVSPNEGGERLFTLRISVPSGEFKDYVFRQKGTDE